MHTLNALSASNNVKKRLVDYCLEEHFVRDAALQQACRAIWDGPPEEGGLMGDLWVEGTFPSKVAGETLEQRVQNGTYHAELTNVIHNNNGFGKAWTPRSIQSESIDHARQGYQATQKPAIVVTAGTGAGKTEAFLLPMLNELFQNEAQAGQGVSAIVLYPMNALVKDQVDRIHSWLHGQSQVRMFSYTGATPDRVSLQKHSDGSRFTCRHEARGLGRYNAQGNFNTQQVLGYRPPEILVTNYSMLEHMLARPQDQVFFGTNLRTIVLDEAHLYRGNLAADIALLLRRIYLRCGVSSDQVLQFATSATIGRDGDEGVRQLREFAGKLFSKDQNLVHVIQGSVAEEPTFSEQASDHEIDCQELHHLPPPDEATLTGGDTPEFSHSNIWNEWTGFCRQVFGAVETEAAIAVVDSNCVAPLLHRLVPRSALFQRLYHALFQNGNPRRMKLRDLAKVVFGTQGDPEVECVRRLLAIGAIARAEPGAMPLIPNRVHTLFRAPEGLAFRFDPNGGCATTRIDDLGHVFSTSRKPRQDDAAQSVVSLSLCRCQDSGEWFFAAVEDGQQRLQEVSAFRMSQDSTWDADDDEDGDEIGDRIRFYKAVDSANATGWMNPENGAFCAQPQPGHVPLKEFTDCPVSGVPLIKQSRFFISSSRLTLSIIAESLLAEMPPLPGNEAGFRPGGGRRLIAFSDSRAEAARMGPTLQTQHEQQILRAVIARVFTENAGEMVAKLRNQLTALNSVPNPEGALDEMIANLTQQIAHLQTGLGLDDLIQGIRNRPELRQLIDDAQRGQPDSGYPDAVWENNLAAVTAPTFLKNRVGVELARRASWPSLTVESTGLIEVVYPGIENLAMPDAMGAIGDPVGRNRLGDHWQAFLELLCDEIRNRNGITTGDNPTDFDQHLGKWVCYQGDANVIQLLPQRNQANTRLGRFLTSICHELGWLVDWQTPNNPAAQILRIAISQLAAANLPWIETDQNAPGIFRLKFRELRFRIPLNYYRCSLTGQVWSRALFGLAPSRSKIQLHASTAEELDLDPLIGRRRTEWKNTGPDDVFCVGLWAEEHSAQLNIDDNERLQNLFKVGLRNILSSTTTLELGIDIGGLSGVVMGNIPPGKANYLQRAGRAGRRADGSSLVCSFARSSPYERKAFLGFDEYIGRELPPPTIHLKREKIALRHLHMYLLSEFMRQQNPGDAGPMGDMSNFGKMGRFTGRNLPESWQPPQQRAIWDIWNLGQLPGDSLATGFLDYLVDISTDAVPGEVMRLCQEIDDLANRWQSILQNASTHFRKVVEDWCEKFNQLANFWNNQLADDQSVRACSAVRREGVAMASEQVITVLGDGLFIPSYGFPIGLMKLHDMSQNDAPDETKRFKLERDCTMAIREYIPGAQLVVGGYRLTSRGILKHWTGANVNNDHNAMLHRGKWMTDGANGFEYEDGFNGNPGLQNQFKPLLFPRHGFTTARWEKPERAYRLNSVRGALVKTNAFNGQPHQNERLDIYPGLAGWQKEGGHLYALHQGNDKMGFAVCLKCGYSQCEIAPKQAPNEFPSGFEQHPAIFSERRVSCWGQDGIKPVMRHQVIAARQVTNFLMVDFSDRVTNQSVAFTLAQALRLAGAELLHLDYREIRTLDPVRGFVNRNGYAAVLYDSLAGGSGHVDELASQRMGKEWLQAAATLLTVEDAASDEWREREGVQRLLTTDIREFDLKELRPLEALQVLNDLLNGVPALNAPPIIPQIPVAVANPNAWDLVRIASGDTLPEQFAFSVPGGGQKLMQPYNDQAPPSNGQYCIVRRADGNLDYGKWCHRALQAGGNAVMMFRLVGSSSLNIQTQTSNDDLPIVIAIE